MRCPKCGADGAVIQSVMLFGTDEYGEITVYCNKCHGETEVSEFDLSIKETRVRGGHKEYRMGIQNEGRRTDMKVSYKGVTGSLVKIERVVQKATNPYCEMSAYALEISDETDGHKHVFENVDVSEIKFIGAAVTLA